MNSELDRIFEQGLSKVTRAPRIPLSDEQIAAAAKESRSGAGVWLRMHAKEILLCAVSVAVGVAVTLLIMHLIGNRDTVPMPTETAATITNDTAYTAMVAEDTATFSGEPTVDTVETQCIASLQTDPNTASAKPNTKTATTAVETHGRASLQTDKPANTSAKHDTEPAVSPVVVKKTVVQRDTVVINETVTIKDTVYLMDN